MQEDTIIKKLEAAFPPEKFKLCFNDDGSLTPYGELALETIETHKENFRIRRELKGVKIELEESKKRVADLQKENEELQGGIDLAGELLDECSVQ